MWTKLDDRTSECEKVDSLSDAAFRLWLMALIWSRDNRNLWLCGRIPCGSLPTIARGKWQGKRLAKLAQELVDAKQGGRSGLGLLEVTEDGWQIHHWDQYGPDKTEFALTPTDVARKGGKASAESRKLREGTAIPKGARNRPKGSDRTGSVEATALVRSELAEPVRQQVRDGTTELTEPPDPDPDLKSPLPLLRVVEPVRSPKPVDARTERVLATASAIDAALAQLESGEERKAL